MEHLILPVFTIACLLMLTVGASAMTCAASYYGNEHHQAITAMGRAYHPHVMSFALRARPHGERYHISRTGHGSVTAIHNDWGPAAWTHRCADVSVGVAKVLGMVKRGWAILTFRKLG